MGRQESSFSLKVRNGFWLVFRGELLQEQFHLVVLLCVTDTLLDHDLLGTQTLSGGDVIAISMIDYTRLLAMTLLHHAVKVVLLRHSCHVVRDYLVVLSLDLR